jgi:hypothetical protein
VLGGLFMHMLVRSWTASNAAAYVAALAFVFAPWRGDSYHWPHLLNVQYIPLYLLLLDRVRNSGRIGLGFLAGGVLLVQLLASYSLAYITVLILACLVATDIAVRGLRRPHEPLLAIGTATILPLLIFCVVSIPYVLSTGGYSPEATRLNSAVVQFCSLPLTGILPLYVSWAEGSLALVALMTVARSGGQNALARVLGLVLALVVTLGVATGHEGLLGGIIAPYEWLSALVPGFSFFRCPLRFGIGASFAASALAGIGAVQLLGLVRDRYRVSLSVALVAAVAAVLLVDPPRPKANPIPTGDSVAPVYHWLAERSKRGALLELPLDRRRPPSDGRDVESDALAMYLSTFHWLPLINGHTSYLPEVALRLRPYAERLPDKAALQRLIDCADLRWILLHRPDGHQRRRWDRLGSSLVRKAFVSPDGTQIVYEVTAPPRPNCGIDLEGD